MEELTIEWPHFGEKITADMWQFFNSEEFSDVVVITEDGKQIKSHRILLAMCSSYFRNLFKYNQTGKHIVCMANVRSDILLKVFGLIYGGIVSVKQSDVQEFIKAAKYLQLNGFEDVAYEDSGVVSPPPNEQKSRSTQNAAKCPAAKKKIKVDGGNGEHSAFAKTFQIRLQRIDLNDDTNGSATKQTKGMATPGMNSFVSSTDVIAGDHDYTAEEKFFPSLSDDSSTDDSLCEVQDA